jgi:hypothetical protein
MKAQFVIDLLTANGNRFTPDQLEQATGTARRARRALFLARRDYGVKLEALRDGGKAVTAYVLNGTVPTVTPTAKASKAPSKAAVAKAKVPKDIHAKSNAIIDKAIKSGAIKLAKVKVTKPVDLARVSNESKAAIKAKNLETMKAVSAKLHPVTKRPMTKTQEDVLDEFAQMEKQAELEEIRAEEQAALRANAPSFLFKETYAE